MAMISADNRGLRLATRYAVLVLIAIIFIFPLVFMLMSSLKPDQQLLQDSGNCAPSCRWATSACTTTPPPSSARRWRPSSSTRSS
jgi:ABC-type glycerol-3-phosphate transport system permease component